MDQELKQQEEAQAELRAILAALEDVIIVFDGDGRCLRIAPTNPDLLYSQPEETVGKRLHEIMPAEQADMFVGHIREALKTGTTQRIEYPMEIAGKQLWFSAAISPMTGDTVLYVARDITERVRAQAALEERVAERTRELNVLLDVSRELTAARTLRPLARAILEQAKRVIDYTGSAAVEFEKGMLRIIESEGPEGREDGLIDVRTSTAPGEPLWGRIRSGNPIVVDDIHGDSEDARLFRATWRADLNSPGFSYLRSWMAIPLGLGGRVVGLLSLSKNVPGYFTQRHLDLALAIARQGSVAADNANLFEATQRRTRELSLLLEVSRALSSTLEMTPLLELILDRVKPMLNCDGAGVSLREADGIRQLAVRRPTGIPMTDAERAPISVPQVEDAIWQHALKGAPLVVEDVLGDTAEAKTFRDVWGGTTKGTPAEYVRGFMTIPLIAKGQTIGVLNFASSQPGYFNQSHVDLVMAVAGPAAAAIENARLFEQTQARTKELSALLEVSRAVVSTLDTRELMGVILDQLHGILEHSGSAILVRDGEDLVIVDARSQAGAEREIGMRIPTAASGVLWRTMAERRPLIIDDIRADEPLANNYREVIGGLGLLEFEPFSSIRAWMAVPLTVSDDVIGMLTMSRTEPGYFKPEQSQLVALFANQAALAIENARLFEESQRSGRETEALFRSDEQIFRSLDLDDVLQALADVAVDLLGAEKTLVTTWDAKERRLVPRASRNWSAQIIEFMQSPEARMTPGGRPEKMVVAEDSAADVAGPWRDVLAAEGIDHWADIALISPENEILGTFAAAYGPDHKLTEADKRMLLALAERAVIAIGNADLHAQARQVTAMEERQRLARELHDSVSQALYGIALGARTARTILDRDPKKAVEPVDYVLSLAEAGLAEMRALIFELRPESLESEGLVAALEKQLAAMKARYGLETIAELGEEPVLSIEQKEVAYRIAQEAMHNVVKHARASSVRVSLSLDGDAVTLTVADDGAGFDPDGDFPGHLGLRSMRERADRAAATLSIESAPGAGTTLTLTMPVSPA